MSEQKPQSAFSPEEKKDIKILKEEALNYFSATLESYNFSADEKEDARKKFQKKIERIKDEDSLDVVLSKSLQNLVKAAKEKKKSGEIIWEDKKTADVDTESEGKSYAEAFNKVIGDIKEAIDDFDDFSEKYPASRYPTLINSKHFEIIGSYKNQCQFFANKGAHITEEELHDAMRLRQDCWRLVNDVVKNVPSTRPPQEESEDGSELLPGKVAVKTQDEVVESTPESKNDANPETSSQKETTDEREEKNFGFETGQVVKIMRDGKLEDGWVVGKIEEGFAEVSKDEVEDLIGVDELRDWQEETVNIDKEKVEMAGEGPTIESPHDSKEEIAQNLRNKIEEYKQRLEIQMRDNPTLAPEVFADTIYKIAVSEAILKDGKVKTHDLSRELKNKHGWFDAQAFNNACGVIEDYISTGGKTVSGGTGFGSTIEAGKDDNFDTLFGYLDEIGGLQGSQEYFTSQQLKDVINDVRQGRRPITAVTREGGLRKEVARLLEKEQSEADSNKGKEKAGEMPDATWPWKKTKAWWENTPEEERKKAWEKPGPLFDEEKFEIEKVELTQKLIETNAEILASEDPADLGKLNEFELKLEKDMDDLVKNSECYVIKEYDVKTPRAEALIVLSTEIYKRIYYLQEILARENKEKSENKKKEERNDKIETTFTPEQQDAINQKLAEFNLEKGDIESIEGFETLSYGQRLMVLENLDQLTLGRIQEEGLRKHKEDVKNAGFLGKVWKNISKKYQIVKAEKAIAGNIKGGGMQAHGEVLKQLINGMKNFGTDVEVLENGELELKYVSEKEFIDLSEEEAGTIKDFNGAATAFSKVPYEWSLDTADKNQKKEYELAKENYEAARNNVLSLKTRKAVMGGFSDNTEGEEIENMRNEQEKQAIAEMSVLENKMRLNQFLNTHPDAESEIQKIESDQVWTKAFKNITTERGLYMGAGFALRSVTAHLAGAIGLPIAAAAMGGVLAWRRTASNLKESEMQARKGGEKSKEVKFIVNAEQSSRVIENYLKRIEQEANEEKKNNLTLRLNIYVKRAQERIERGMIDFGSNDKRIANQFKLVDQLGQATLYLNSFGNVAMSKELQNKIAESLNLKEEKVDLAQRNRKIKEAAKGAAYGAGFAAAGWLARHFIDVIGGVEMGSGAGRGAGEQEAVRIPTEPIAPEVEVGNAGKTAVVVEVKAGIMAESAEKLGGYEIKKGEGYWHAVKNQLQDWMENNPEEFAKHYNLSQENFDSPEEVKKILDRETMNILKQNEIIDTANGKEIRISDAGTKIILNKNGHIEIYGKDGGSANVYETTFGTKEGIKVAPGDEALDQKSGVSGDEALDKKTETTGDEALDKKQVVTDDEAINQPVHAGGEKIVAEAQVLSFKDISNWLEKDVKINVAKSSWVTENFLKNHTIGEVMKPNFAGKQDGILGFFRQSEFGSNEWVEMHEKEIFQDKMEKILRQIPKEQRAALKDTKLYNFISLYGKIRGG